MDPARLQSVLASYGSRSQLLTYIRLRYAARSIIAASLDGFSRASTSTAPGHWPKPCRSRHQVREATEVTRFAIFRHSIAIVGEALSRRILLSGGANRKPGVIGAVAGEQAPGNACILVSERDGDNVGVSPLPHST